MFLMLIPFLSSRRRYAILCVFLFVAQLVSGQSRYPVSQQKLDSALHLNQQYLKRDSVKLKILETIYRQYIGLKKRDQANYYMDQVIALAHEKNLRQFSAYAYYRRALGFHGQADYMQSEDNYLKAQVDFAAVGDIEMVAGVNLNLSDLYSGIPDFVKALEVSQKAIAIYEKAGIMDDLASCYVNVSYVYQRLGSHASAIMYLKKALDIFLKEGENTRGVAVVYQAMGLNYFEAKETELPEMNIKKAEQSNLVYECYAKGLKVAEILNDVGLIAALNGGLGDFYLSVNKSSEALVCYKKAVDISATRENKYDLAYSFFALGNYYRTEKLYNDAIRYLTSALKIAEDNRLMEIEEKACFALSDVHEQLKEYNRSLAYYRQYVAIKDQILDKDKKREIIKHQLTLDFGVKEHDYLMKQKISESELKRQKQQLALRRQQLILADKEQALSLLSFQKAKLALDLQHLEQENKLQKQTNLARLAASEKDKKILSQNQQIKVDWRIKIFLTTAVTLVLIIALLIFLSQRKTSKLNQIINLQKRELEQLGKVKDRIFSVVSHDMRTPVNSLISFIQLLEGGDIEKEKLRRYSATLKNTLTYTSTMMENLLNWAASQMQGFNPYLEELDLNEVTTEVTHTLSGSAIEKNISIRNRVPVQTLCKADLNMLSLVIRNLVSNAIKFTPNDGFIDISIEDLKDGVNLKISDTGIGLTAKQISHFNKPGYLGAGISTPGTNREKGTGLGLLLCRTFIGLMDGKISAHLNEQRGSFFLIRLKK